VVVSIALVALVTLVAVVVLELPAAQKDQNIIAVAIASFAVIGAIVGAYFGVSSSNRAAEIVRSIGARTAYRKTGRLRRPIPSDRPPRWPDSPA
jgi:uncharacterized protein YybS (DUF2232 family)